MNSQPALTQEEQIAQDIIKFAQDNNLQLHPGQDAESWAGLVLISGGCPCVRGRNPCPCQQALDDIKEINRCRCGLFCNDAYLREYNSLNALRKSKKRWIRKPKGSS